MLSTIQARNQATSHWLFIVPLCQPLWWLFQLRLPWIVFATSMQHLFEMTVTVLLLERWDYSGWVSTSVHRASRPNPIFVSVHACIAMSMASNKRIDTESCRPTILLLTMLIVVNMETLSRWYMMSQWRSSWNQSQDAVEPILAVSLWRSVNEG